MTTQLRDVLTAICSSVDEITSNEHQDVYALGDAKEAKIAHDLLAAHGFDVKLYHEPGMAKLYYGHAPLDAATLSARFAGIVRYASAFKSIKTTLDALAADGAAHIADYGVTFSKSAGGMQLGIQLVSDNVSDNIAKKQLVTSSVAQSPIAAKPALTKGLQAKPEDGMMSAGPKMMAQYTKYSKKDRGEDKASGVKNTLMRFFVQNIASNTVAILSAITVILVLSGVLIAVKGIICPDLATVKSKQWYCLSEEEKKMRPAE